MADFNKIYANSPLNISNANMAVLAFIDGEAVLSNKYSLANYNLTLFELNNSEASVYYNYGVATVYEYELSLYQPGIILPTIDVKQQKLKNLIKQNLLVFIDGKLLHPDEYDVKDYEYIVINSAYTKSQSTLNSIVIYSSSNKTIYRETLDNSIIHNFSNATLNYNINNTVIFKNGLKIPYYDIDSTDPEYIKLKVEATNTDVIEIIKFDYEPSIIPVTRSVNFKTDLGYLSYGPYDNFGNKVPQLYDTIITFADQAKLAVNNLRPGFIVKEEDGYGELLIVSDTFETTWVKCLRIQAFRNSAYLPDQYYLEVPQARSITHYLANYDKQFKFLPEILEIFQRLLLDELNDSIERLRNIRNISKVDSENINKLISLLGCNLNIKTLTLKQRHALLDELTEFYRRVGTRDSYNFLNILQDDLKLIDIEQLFTPHTPQKSTIKKIYTNDIQLDPLSPGKGYTAGMLVNIGDTGLTTVVSKVDANGAIQELSDGNTTEESTTVNTGRWPLTVSSPDLTIPITSTPTDYNVTWNVNGGKSYVKGEVLTTADGEYSITVTDVNNNGTITNWTPRTTTSKRSIVENYLTLYEANEYHAKLAVTSTPYNEEDLSQRRLPTNLSKPSINTSKTKLVEVYGNSYKTYTIPSSGWYYIETAGSAGGTASTAGGAGGKTAQLVYLYKGTQCLLWGANGGTTGYPAPNDSILGGRGASGYAGDGTNSGGGGGSPTGNGNGITTWGGAGSGFIAGFATASDIPYVSHVEGGWTRPLTTTNGISAGSAYNVAATYVYLLGAGGGGGTGKKHSHRGGGAGGGAWGNGGEAFWSTYTRTTGPGNTWGQGEGGNRYSAGGRGAWACLDFSTNNFITGLGGNGSTTGYTVLYKIQTPTEEFLVYSRNTAGNFSVTIPSEIQVTRVEFAGADGGKAWVTQGGTTSKISNSLAYPSGEKITITDQFILSSSTITGTIGATPNASSMTTAKTGGIGDGNGQTASEASGIQSGAGGGATTIVYNGLKYGAAGGAGQSYGTVTGANGGQPNNVSIDDNYKGTFGTGTESNGYIKIYGFYKQSGEIPVFNSNTPGNYTIVLQPGTYSYDMSGGGGAGGAADSKSGTTNDWPADNGQNAEFTSGSFTISAPTTIKIYVGQGGKSSKARGGDTAPEIGGGGSGYTSGQNGIPMHFNDGNVGTGSGGGSSAIAINSDVRIAAGGNGGNAGRNAAKIKGITITKAATYAGGTGGNRTAGKNTSGAAGGIRNQNDNSFTSQAGSNGWVNIKYQLQTYTGTIDGSTAELYKGNVLRTVTDKSNNKYSVVIDNTNPLKFHLIPSTGFEIINGTYELQRLQNTTASLSLNSVITQYKYNYTLPEGKINEHIIPGVKLYAIDSTDGQEFTYTVNSIDKKTNTITSGILSPATGTTYRNTTLYPELRGYSDAYVYISSELNTQSNVDKEYIDFYTKQELGAVKIRKFFAEKVDYGLVSEGTPNSPYPYQMGEADIDYDLVSEPITKFYDYGFVTEQVEGEWREWWEWNRGSQWYPTNHVRVEMKIPTGVDYVEYVERFTEQFYNIASTVLYIHEITTSFYFGKDVTAPNDPNDTKGAFLGIMTAQPVTFETITVTSDPGRQFSVNN